MNYRDKFTVIDGTKIFHIEQNYDWKQHKPIFQIWRYDPSACAIYKALTYPFGDCPKFDSFIQAVKYLKTNIKELA